MTSDSEGASFSYPPIDAVFGLSDSIFVDVDVLGRTFHITLLTGEPAELAFPMPPLGGLPTEPLDTSGGVRLLAEPLFEDGIALDLQTAANALRKLGALRWGHAYNASAVVSAFRLRTKLNPGQVPISVAATSALLNLGTTWSAIRDWVCVWSGESRYTVRYYEDLWLTTALPGDDATTYFSEGGPSRMGFNKSGLHPMTSRAFAEAEKYVSLRTEMPFVFQLLLQSSAEFGTGGLRLAVIEACTAAEVAMSSAIRSLDQAKTVPPTTLERSLSDAHGIADLYRLFLLLGGDLICSESRVMHQLAGVRNAATHTGHAPSAVEATKAMDTARLIVKATTSDPWPDL
jgi:hypothetical protein